MESVLKIDKLKYKDILKDVTFSLENKSFNVLVGANGSGKTTIVNAIRNLINYEGSITVLGIDIRDKTNYNKYREVGFFTDKNIVLEDSLFNDLLNMLKNLDYEEEKAKKRIFSIAKKMDITDLLFKNLEELSNYQLTKISFVFSIIHEPKLLIIDNDLENLNNVDKKRILNYIKNQSKLTVLFITNNSELFYNVDNFLLLKDGKIISFKTLEEVALNEKTLIKCGSNLPFYIELSNKLILYELLDRMILEDEEMVNEIWK